MTEPFHGAKIAILVGDKIITILRDDIATIPWPGHWDLPGGGRENNETPTECALRELHEELGLTPDPARIKWLRKYPSAPNNVWFLVAEWPDFAPALVNFGDEGQEWRLVPISWFLAQPKAIPQHKDRLKTYLKLRNPADI